MVTVADYKSIKPSWCPGCGNFGILNAVKKALVNLGKAPSDVLFCSGIGQAGKFPHYLACNIFNGLHGRAVPAAFAAKVANHQMTVIAVGGDGDMYGEGGNHLLHNMRRNIDITVLIHDNQVYGLTKGQASPTTESGRKTLIQPSGVVSRPFNPIAWAISQHCSFVARSFSGNLEHLTQTVMQAIQNRGFSLVDILQPCVTFNKVNTFDWYRTRAYALDETYNPTDHQAAQAKAGEWGDKIPIGVIYKHPDKTYEEWFPQLQGKPLTEKTVDRNKVNELINMYL
jgi:2-oxoglutarate ferredoxin oxidoreductase subunit beta